MHKEHVVHQGAHVLGLAGDLRLEDIAHMYGADDVVQGLFVDREAGDGAVLGQGEDLLPAVLDVDSHDVHPGGDDLLDLDLVKVQRRLYQVAFLFLQHAFLLDGFDDVLELLLGDRRLGSVFRLGDAVGELHKEEHQRAEQLHQQAERAGKAQRQRLAIFLGVGLGQDLAEDQHHDGHDHRGDRSALLRPHQAAEEHGGDGGGGDVHHVVSDKHRGQRPLKIIGDLQHGIGPLVSLLGVVFDPDAVERRKRRLGGRKVGRTRNQSYQHQQSS